MKRIKEKTVNDQGFDWQASLIESASVATLAFILLLVLWFIGFNGLHLGFIISMWPGIFVGKVFYNYVTGKYIR